MLSPMWFNVHLAENMHTPSVLTEEGVLISGVIFALFSVTWTMNFALTERCPHFSGSFFKGGGTPAYIIIIDL